MYGKERKEMWKSRREGIEGEGMGRVIDGGVQRKKISIFAGRISIHI